SRSSFKSSLKSKFIGCVPSLALPDGSSQGGDAPSLAASAKPATVKCDEALPVALGSRLVVDLALREGEPMMHAGIELKLARTAGLFEEAPQLLDHRQRRQLVDFGAGNVELGLALAERQVRAFRRLAHEPGAVEGRCRGNASGIARGRGKGI